MAYSLEDRFPPPPKYFTFYDPGAYQYEKSRKCKPSKAPFNSLKPRDTQAGAKIWTHTIYDASLPKKITNCTAMQSKVPRFPYEALSKEDIEDILCRCGFQDPCECPIEEEKEETFTCHAKIPRRLFKGPAPPPLLGNGLSAPSKGDRGFKLLPNGSTKRIKDKVTNESPPFYDATVNEFTKFYHGCKWSQQTSKRSVKTIELSPGPANYVFEKTSTDYEKCSEKYRMYKRKTSKQLRFIEMVQQRNILENLPGPASYRIQYPRSTNLQYLGPKANRFSIEKYDDAPGPADYWVRRDFDVAELPEFFCHARLPEPSCFGVKDTRFKALKEIGPSPATYSPTYNPCHFMKCSKAPFGISANRFKEDLTQNNDEEKETTASDQEEENNKKSCEIPTWQFKSKSKRFEKLTKKLNEPSPADLRQSRIKVERSRQLQYIAPFFASEGRFQPWNDWMPVFGRVKTPGPCTYKLDKPKCNTAVPHGPLSRSARFPAHGRDSPAPNEYYVGCGIETVLSTHNERLKHNIENQHKFIWTPPVEPKQLTCDEQIALLLKKSIALLDVEKSMEEKSSKPVSAKSSAVFQHKNKSKNDKLLRSFLHNQKVVDYY